MNRPFKPDDGALSGPQHLWKIAQATFASGAPFTVRDLFGLSNGVSRVTVKQTVASWVAQGAAQALPYAHGRQSDGKWRAAAYRLTSEATAAPVRRRANYTGDRGRRQQQLWTAMRSLPQFGIPELAYAASTDELFVDNGIARSYVGRLLKAGLLLSLLPYSKGTKGGFGKGAHAGLYRLKPSANTGPKAPRVLKDGSVFDPNVAQPTANKRAPVKGSSTARSTHARRIAA